MVTFWNQNKLLILFFIALTVVTVLSLSDFNSDEQTKDLTAHLQTPIQKTLEKNSLRLPASVDGDSNSSAKNPNSETLSNPTKNESSQVQVFCKTGTQPIQTKKSLMMLEISSCIGLTSKHPIWVRNSSNGFKAQVFKLSDKNFRTDFIQLTKGVNKITIEGVLKDGQKIAQELEIVTGS